MSRTFAEYGLTSEEFDGLVLEDPATFDTFLVRVVEDLDLVQQITAGDNDKGEIPEWILERAFGVVENINRHAGRNHFLELNSARYDPKVPDELRAIIQFYVNSYIRGPLPYVDGTLEQFVNVVTVIAYDALAIGGTHAREDDTKTVKLRHWLPACENWPYPLNRFC